MQYNYVVSYYYTDKSDISHYGTSYYSSDISIDSKNGFDSMLNKLMTDCSAMNLIVLYTHELIEDRLLMN